MENEQDKGHEKLENECTNSDKCTTNHIAFKGILSKKYQSTTTYDSLAL